MNKCLLYAYVLFPRIYKDKIPHSPAGEMKKGDINPFKI